MLSWDQIEGARHMRKGEWTHEAFCNSLSADNLRTILVSLNHMALTGPQGPLWAEKAKRLAETLEQVNLD